MVSVPSLDLVSPVLSDRIRVIFLDAVGTLFGIQGSVGHIYRQLALPFGVNADADLLNQAFFKSFLAATPMAFPDATPDQIPQREFDWWRAIALETFDRLNLLQDFQDFELFFQDLYEYFATPQPWFVYPDVPTTLAHWQDQGIELAVLSNFDSRLYPVLEGLGLSSFFSSITISTEVGAAKPDRAIFHAALDKQGCSPEETCHIGDSLTADYEGAQQLGLQAVWLQR